MKEQEWTDAPGRTFHPPRQNRMTGTEVAGWVNGWWRSEGMKPHLAVWVAFHRSVGICCGCLLPPNTLLFACLSACFLFACFPPCLLACLLACLRACLLACISEKPHGVTIKQTVYYDRVVVSLLLAKDSLIIMIRLYWE